MSQDPSFPAPPPPPAAPPPVAPPPPAGGAGGSEGPRLPWEERDRLGFFNALIETVTLIVTAPRDAFSRLRPDGDYLWPLVFGLIFSWVGQFFGQIWNLILGNALKSWMSGISDLTEAAQYMGTGPVQVVVSLIIWPVIYVVVMFLFAGISHLALMMVSALDDSPLGFEGTFKVVAYSSVLDLLSVVPFIGWLLAFVAKLVLYVIGFSAVHRASEGKALGAVAIVLAICCCCLPAILAGLFGLMGASMAALLSVFASG